MGGGGLTIRGKSILGGGGVAAAAVIVAGFAGASRDEDYDRVRRKAGLGIRRWQSGVRVGRRWNSYRSERGVRRWGQNVRGLEAVAGELKLGDGAKDAPLECDHSGIGRTACTFVAEPVEGRAKDGNEPRGG